ncbi:DoxX family protein [Mesorhizobium tamadayense]|uniref:DoxX family protein n=1 Tax=Mesorhizobium tamadayense TaxID=425306 RepID=A0A3P3F3M0_9HYPH|nr:DoxX family protein [Mesorhizobium tamadayense]RRH92158.1 DoxX family protein [Mesorhizobium tamadayense]
MSVSQSSPASAGPSSRSWHIGLWAAQLVLVILFGWPGIMKTFMDPSVLPPMGIVWATDVPIWFLRFIGLCELAGAFGMILPTATRILPFLTPLAALGFVTIQVLAIGFHAFRGETSHTLPMNVVFLALSLFVLWGRTRKAPITRR